MSLVRRWNGLARLSIVCAALVAGCGDGAKEGPKGTPIAELIAAGKAPVEIGGLSRSMGPVPSFRCRIRNLSDRAIDAVGWTALFRDREGKPMGSPTDGGYADGLSPIEPGAEIQGMFGAPDDAATSAVLVLKQVIYRMPNPLGAKFGTLAAKWTNPRHATEVEAAGKP